MEVRRLWILACSLTLAPLAHAKPPNILFIIADDLGYSDLGCYGGEIDTPNLDALAKNGLRLTQHYNTGRCCPSRASLLTGQYPHAVGLGHMTKDLGRPGYAGRVSENAQTLAQALAPAGYRSFISGKWHLGTEVPTQHGFEEFYGTLVSAKTFWEEDHFTRLPAGHPKRAYADGQFYGTDAVTDHALDFLTLARESANQPWFLYLAYNAPHFPLHAKPADIAKYAKRYHVGWDAIREERLAHMKELGLVADATTLSPRSEWWNYGATETGTNPAWESLPEDRRADLARRMAIFAAMVDCMDQNIGRVIANLRAAGEIENTLIVFLSDNGACAEWDPRGFDGSSSPNNTLHRGDEIGVMGSKGTFHSVGSGWANASNTPWRFYKHFTHEGGISTPCIIHWPAGVRRHDAMDPTPTHIIDWMPTFLDLAEITPAPQAMNPAGVSLRPLFEGESMNERTLFFEHEGHRAVRRGPWKLVALRDQPWTLHDIENDRTELKDLSANHPALVNELTDAWEAWAQRLDVTPFPTNYGVDYLPSN